jgi:hypothetical protein
MHQCKRLSLIFFLLLLPISQQTWAQTALDPCPAPQPFNNKEEDKAIDDIHKSLASVPRNAQGLRDQNAIVNAIKNIKGICSVYKQPDGSVSMSFLDGNPFVVVNNQATKAQ